VKGGVSGTACGRGAWLTGSRGWEAVWLDMLDALSALMVPQLPPLALCWADEGVLPVVPPAPMTSLRARSCASPAVHRRAELRLPMLPLRLNRNAASDSVCLRLRLRVARLCVCGTCRCGLSLWALPWRTQGGLRQHMELTSWWGSLWSRVTAPVTLCCDQLAKRSRRALGAELGTRRRLQTLCRPMSPS
jgi:hypothetical protein